MASTWLAATTGYVNRSTARPVISGGRGGVVGERGGQVAVGVGLGEKVLGLLLEDSEGRPVGFMAEQSVTVLLDVAFGSSGSMC